MYRADCSVIIGFLLATWLVLAFVLAEVLRLAPGPLVGAAWFRATAVLSALVMGLFATAALVAVLAHLKKNRDALYREDLGQRHIPAEE